MKFKPIIRYILLLVAFGSIAVRGAREYEKSNQDRALAGASGVDALPSAEGKQIVMTYFRNGMRCSSCKLIEKYTTAAASEDLAEEIASGRLVFRVINVDEPANNHFIEEYNLTSKTVVLSYRVNGVEKSWESMDQIWELLDKSQNFRAYLAEPVRQYLK